MPPGVSRVKMIMAITPSVIPVITSGLAPVRGSTRVWAVTEVATRTPVSGRKARPAVSGEKPRVSCM